MRRGNLPRYAVASATFAGALLLGACSSGDDATSDTASDADSAASDTTFDADTVSEPTGLGSDILARFDSCDDVAPAVAPTSSGTEPALLERRGGVQRLLRMGDPGQRHQPRRDPVGGDRPATGIRQRPVGERPRNRRSRTTPRRTTRRSPPGRRESLPPKRTRRPWRTLRRCRDRPPMAGPQHARPPVRPQRDDVGELSPNHETPSATSAPTTSRSRGADVTRTSPSASSGMRNHCETSVNAESGART
ncbi:hypothetical protein SAMN04490240_2960 [Rhodococcus pyridinivorans]|nr:hypothetical protein SAMN04490240_2960 [Rhodococcus pyridinivorans]